MQVTVVGSGTLVPEPTRVSASHVLRSEAFMLFLDVGAGAVRRMAEIGLDWSTVSHVALSHFHTDHFCGLPELFSALRHGCDPPRRERLHLIGPPGLSERMSGLATAFGSFILDPDFPLELHEVGRSAVWDDPAGAFSLRTFPAHHTLEAVAMRVNTDGLAVGYTGDTGPVDGLADFMSGVDVLIAECSFPDPPPTDTHMTPSGLGALASAALPGQLLVSHVYPGLSSDAILAGINAEGFDGPVVLAEDGTSVRLA